MDLMLNDLFLDYYHPKFGIFFVVLLVLCPASVYWLKNLRSQLPLPPGPRGLPLLGNAFQIRDADRWRTYQKWHKKYGPIIRISSGSKTMIILGSYKTARDLLEKRSEIYSSRPTMVVPLWLSGGYNTTALPYGIKWRSHHRIQAALLNVRMSQKYRILQDVESKQVMHELLETNDFIPIFHRFSSSLIFTLAYGERLSHCNHDDIRQADHILEDFVYACYHFWFLEYFPLLNHLPRWLAKWKYWGEDYHRKTMGFFENKFIEAQNKTSWNWCKEARKINESSKDTFCITNSEELAYVVGLLHEAASHTTDKALQFFIMACVLHQESVALAQKELDCVIGSNRMPEFEDMSHLPYTMAFINEMQRWRPLTLEGVAHASQKEDIYMGYRIPQGSVVTANYWSLDMDEELFPEPDEFRPERWLQQPNLPSTTFGFGRRICAGQHLARNSLFIIASRILWAYDIKPGQDENGKNIEVDSWSMIQNISTKPSPFEVVLQVRSDQHRDVIVKAWADADKDPDVILNNIYP
ncbi:hypothetical protein FQN57_004350 [Myotisia sp. PD_48]|nr:hypothetical protein FQN57_004350 [Myotisia sp. PD_48]